MCVNLLLDFIVAEIRDKTLKNIKIVEGGADDFIFLHPQNYLDLGM